MNTYVYSFHHGGGIIGCECKICGEMIEAGTNEVNRLISCHIIKHHSLGKGLVKISRYSGFIEGNFPKSINNPLPGRAHHDFSRVLEIFPQLPLLKVDDNADFDRILCERIFEVSNKPERYSGPSTHSVVHNLSCVFYNTNYFCCICDIPYDSGLPSMEIIMEHIKYCLIA